MKSMFFLRPKYEYGTLGNIMVFQKRPKRRKDVKWSTNYSSYEFCNEYFKKVTGIKLKPDVVYEFKLEVVDEQV